MLTGPENIMTADTARTRAYFTFMVSSWMGLRFVCGGIALAVVIKHHCHSTWGAQSNEVAWLVRNYLVFFCYSSKCHLLSKRFASLGGLFFHGSPVSQSCLASPNTRAFLMQIKLFRQS
jgi:hypothetical protein